MWISFQQANFKQGEANRRIIHIFFCLTHKYTYHCRSHHQVPRKYIKGQTSVTGFMVLGTCMGTDGYSDWYITQGKEGVGLIRLVFGVMLLFGAFTGSFQLIMHVFYVHTNTEETFIYIKLHKESKFKLQTLEPSCSLDNGQTIKAK